MAIAVSSKLIANSIQRESIGVDTRPTPAPCETVVDALEVVCEVWSLVTLAEFTIVPVNPNATANVAAGTVMVCPILKGPRSHGNPRVHGAPTER
jgi:hypothetical protein